MLNSNERIIKHKLGLLNLAEELGNVSQAWKVMGLSRDTFYRYKSAVSQNIHPFTGLLVIDAAQRWRSAASRASPLQRSVRPVPSSFVAFAI